MIKKILIGLLVVVLLVVGAFIIWALTPLGPMPEALAAMESGNGVQVTQDDWLVFMPEGSQPKTGIIFYPGGRVDYRSYAPYARSLAEAGYLAIITPMPLNLAVFDPNRAADVIRQFPEITKWVISGHSLGGAMAANFIDSQPDKVDGLIFLASYPADSDNLADNQISVLDISASEDGLSTEDKIAASRALLPTETKFIEIQGGNHAQFGWYGDQPGDGVATISREDQQAQMVSVSLPFLQTISEGK